MIYIEIVSMTGDARKYQFMIKKWLQNGYGFREIFIDIIFKLAIDKIIGKRDYGNIERYKSRFKVRYI